MYTDTTYHEAIDQQMPEILPLHLGMAWELDQYKMACLNSLIKTYAYLYTNLRKHILEASKSQSESLRVTRVDSQVERQYLTRVTADIVQCPGVTLSVTENTNETA